MKRKECVGKLRLTGKDIDARLISFASKRKNWLKARGKLFLPIVALPPHDTGQWQVGVFVCHKEQHRPHHDVFSLTATDDGEIIKHQNNASENRVIDVSLLRINIDHSDKRRPSIHSYED